jgi:cell wall-associated NlpC family hydrolase
MPNRDDAENEQRRFGVTKLHAKPRGRVLQELAAGTRVRVTGDAEGRFVPIVVPGQRLRGWVRQDDLAPVHVPIRDPDGDGRPETGGGTVSGGVPAGSDVGSRIAAEALTYVGFPYRLGTRGPTTFDCSGLVQWVVKQVTTETISPDSHAQFNLGTRVGTDRLQAGDLLFYDTMHGQEVREGNAASHVGIFVAPGQMVSAMNPEIGVRVDDPFSPTYFASRFIGARRLF